MIQQRFLQLAEPRLVIPPTSEAAAVDGLADLLSARRVHRSLGFEEAQAVFLKRHTDVVEQPPDLPLEIVDEVVVDQAMYATWQDFVEFGEFNRLFVAHARASLKAGKSPEQAMMDFKLPDTFKGYNLGGGRGGPGGNFNILFEELKGGK